MDDELQKAADAGKITTAQAAQLEQLSPGTFCLHKSWGFGQIDSINHMLNQVVIHFTTKRDHSMQLPYAAESLEPVPNDHILARKATELDAVKKEASENPTALVRCILASYGGAALPAQIADALTPEVYHTAAARKWWDSTKKLLKKDGHFAIPAKRTEPVTLREEALSRTDELLDSVQNARQLKPLIAALDAVAKEAEEFSADPDRLRPVILRASDEARKNQKLKTVEAMEILAARDEIAKVAGIEAPEPSMVQMVRDEEKRLRDIFAELAVSKQKRVFAAFPEAFGDEWVRKATQQMMQAGNVRVVAEVARLLQDAGKSDQLRYELDRSIRDHSITSEVLWWLCKDRKGEFKDLIGPAVFSTILISLERDQMAESKKMKLHDLLMDDRELVPDLLRDATPGVARDSMRRFMMTPVFEELNKRSLLARIVKTHPELTSMLEGNSEPAQREDALIVSWASLEVRKLAYEELIKRKIPENVKEISIAREYGDLRENFEFKAAKEQQLVLQRQKMEMEMDLERSRGTNFENPDTTQVSIGTVVTVRDRSGMDVSYTILGAWDGHPEKNVLSYKTQIGQALLGQPVGTSVTVPTDTGEQEVAIVSIEAWRQEPAAV